MNVLLVYPEMPDTFWSMQHALKVLGKKAFFPPLGLLTIAALLPERWGKRLVDTNVRPVGDDDLDWADAVFLSAMNVQEPSARALIAQARAAGVPVVAGGPLFTHEWELFPDVDHFILNEAELTLQAFVEDVEAGRTPERIYAHETAHGFADMTTSPTPMWELAPLDEYMYGIVQYTRGCPYECDFCDVTSLFGRKPRVKEPAQIIDELDRMLDRADVTFVMFADDNLIGNKKRLKRELLPALIEWRRRRRPSVYFGTQVTINLADDEELMDLMIDAGFRQLFVGIETPDDETLQHCLKRQNRKRDLLENVERLHARGFTMTAGFVVGFDTDTEDIFDRQIRFIQESGIVLATVNLLKAPPGTALYDRMEREGRLLDRFSFEETRTNFVPAMDADTLYAGFDRVIETVYSPEAVYERAMEFFRQYRPAQPTVGIPDPNPLRYVGLVLRAHRHIGLSRRLGPYYWRLLGWALRHNRRALDIAMNNAIMLYQLDRLYASYADARASTGRQIAGATHFVHSAASQGDGSSAGMPTAPVARVES